MSNKRKDALLGEPHGTAANRLRKMVLFKILVDTDQHHCYRCGHRIEKVEDLSIEHTVPWQSATDPRAAFFDVEKIAFSHLSCNIAAAEKVNKLDMTPDQRLEHSRRQSREASRRWQTPEKRRDKYLRTGH